MMSVGVTPLTFNIRLSYLHAQQLNVKNFMANFSLREKLLEKLVLLFVFDALAMLCCGNNGLRVNLCHVLTLGYVLNKMLSAS